MITDYSKIEEDHKVLTDFLNKVYYLINLFGYIYIIS